jgi:hypothetical protein
MADAEKATFFAASYQYNVNWAYGLRLEKSIAASQPSNRCLFGFTEITKILSNSRGGFSPRFVTKQISNRPFIHSGWLRGNDG